VGKRPGPEHYLSELRGLVSDQVDSEHGAFLLEQLQIRLAQEGGSGPYSGNLSDLRSEVHDQQVQGIRNLLEVMRNDTSVEEVAREEDLEPAPRKRGFPLPADCARYGIHSKYHGRWRSGSYLKGVKT
jgi:hypothetical protein